MPISIEEVNHIAELARLKLNSAEILLFQRQLSEILEYAARLQQVDVAGVSPTSSIGQAENTLRKDTPQPGLTIDQLLANAVEVEERQFRVPPILD